MTKSKIIDAYNRYGKYIMIAIISGLLFFANLWKPCWIIALVFSAMLFVFASPTELFAYVFYFQMFSAMDLFFVFSLILCFVILMARYVIEVVYKKKKIFILPLILTIVIALVFSLINYGTDSGSLQNGALAVACLFLIYIAFVYWREIDIIKCFKFLALGMIVSGILSFASLLIPNANYSIFHIDHTFKRVKLFVFHVNFLSMLCLFNIAFVVFKIVNEKGNIFENIFSIILSTILGVLTLSKTFFLVWIIMMLYLAVHLIITYKLKSLRVIIPTLALCVILCFVFEDFVINILKRFLAYGTSSSIIDRLLTGRIGLWKQYLAETTSSAWKILFGVGFFTKEINSLGPHSVPIYFFFRIGVVGIMLLGCLIYSYFKCSKSKIKITFKNSLPFFIWTLIALEEMIFTDRFLIFLLLFISLLVSEKKESGENYETKKEEENAEQN